MTDKVLDFIEKRKENVEAKRRNFERILFQNFLGAYSVIDQGGVIFPISLVDVSHDGCLFEVPWNASRDSKFEEGLEISMRMYFTKASYVPVVVNVKYGREHIGKDGNTYMQYGCEFDQSLPSFQVMNNFIDFMYSFAEHSAIDRGDQKVFFY